MTVKTSFPKQRSSMAVESRRSISELGGPGSEGLALTHQPPRRTYPQDILPSPQEQADLWFKVCTCSPQEFVDLSRTILDNLSSGHGPTAELLALRHILDIDCNQRFHLYRPEIPHLSTELVIRAIVGTSGLLTSYHGDDSLRRREWQLRALISALTSLYYSRVVHLHDETLKRIERACGQLALDVSNQRRLAAENELQSDTCLYLISLVDEYLSTWAQPGFSLPLHIC